VVARLAVDDFHGARELLAGAPSGGGAGSPSDIDVVEQLALRVSFYEGALEDVRDACEAAIASARWQGEARAATLATAHAMLAVVDVQQAGLEAAVQDLRSARRAAALAGGQPAGDVVMIAEALQQGASARPDLALRALWPLYEEPAAWADALLMGPEIVPLACRVAVAAGHGALAGRVLACAAEVAREHGGPPALVAALGQATGNLAGDPGPLVEAARTLASSPRRLAAAAVAEDAALAVARSGQPERAVALAREALARYTDCAATTGARRVRQWLRSHGVNLIPGQRRGRPSFGWDAVSDAELLVIKLAAEGLTNREIGERLYLSRYTVDTHLRHVFAKLGVSSRVWLTRAYLDHLAKPD
jgi:DNA-binding CsgD family transcriptional regulator